MNCQYVIYRYDIYSLKYDEDMGKNNTQFKEINQKTSSSSQQTFKSIMMKIRWCFHHLIFFFRRIVHSILNILIIMHVMGFKCGV